MRGDHLRVDRGGYWHHGIDLGNGEVVHFAGEPLAKRQARVQVTSQARFARGAAVQTIPYGPEALHPDHTCVVALGRVGGGGYRLATNNCEHLARFCKVGTAESHQIKELMASVVRSLGIALVHPSYGASRLGAEGLGRVGGFAHQQLARLVSEPREQYAAVFGPALYRMALWYQGADGGLYVQAATPSWWFVCEGDGQFRRLPDHPGVPVCLISQIWLSTAGHHLCETDDGWSLIGGPREIMLIDWRPGGRDGRLGRAPLAALNALLDCPASWDELHGVLDELWRREPRRGDAATTLALTRWAGLDVTAACAATRERVAICRDLARTLLRATEGRR